MTLSEAQRVMEAERELWAAVLIRGLCDFFKVDISERPKDRIQREARHWIFSNRQDPGSFHFCAELFGLDPTAVRKQLLRITSERFRRQLHPDSN